MRLFSANSVYSAFATPCYVLNFFYLHSIDFLCTVGLLSMIILLFGIYCFAKCSYLFMKHLII